jgi:hypothetical protein
MRNTFSFKLLGILFLSLFILSTAYGGVFNSGKEKFQDMVCDNNSEDVEIPECKCAENEVRILTEEWASFELGIIFPVIIRPTNGQPQGELGSFEVKLTHNLSNTFSVWGGYSHTTLKKDEYEGSAYGSEWEFKMVSGGVALMFTEQSSWNLKVYGGFGQILEGKDNEDNSQSYEMSTIMGTEIIVPFNSDHPTGIRWTVGYEDIQAPVKGDKHITEANADAGMNKLYVGLLIPL